MFSGKLICAANHSLSGVFVFSALMVFLFISSTFPAQADLLESSWEMLNEGEFSEEKTEEKKRFLLKYDFDQSIGLIVSANHVSKLSISGSFQFKDSWNASVSQPLFRSYFRNPNSNDKGLRIQDTLLSVKRLFSDLPYNSRLEAELRSALPVSQKSQTNDIRTVSSAYLNWSVNLPPLLNMPADRPLKNITLSIQPVARRYFSKYSTTPTYREEISQTQREEIPQTQGGKPLPKFLFGVQKVNLSLGFKNAFSLDGALGGWAVFPHKIKYQRDPFSPFKKTYPELHYLISLSANVQIKKRWTFSLYYSHLDRIDKFGSLRVVFLHDKVSAWGLSASYSFGFNGFDSLQTAQSKK